MNESLKYKLYKSENNFPELIKMNIYSLVLGTLLLTKIQESIVLAQNTGSSLLNGTVYRTISNIYDDVLNGYDSRILPRFNKLPPLQNRTVSFQFRLLHDGPT